MKKSLLIVIALIFVASAGYARHKKKVKKTKNDIVSISMHRTACFGRCPDYMIEVYNDGIVKYFGYNFVKDSGVYQKTIGTAKAAQLLNKFKEYRVDTCQDVYKNMIPDLPGITYEIRYADKTKSIHNAQFGPSFLKDLSYTVDEEGKVDGSWKKIISSEK